MYRLLRICFFSFFPGIVLAQSSDQPKLIIGVVVDQMRHEYLYRFSDHYGDMGFKRLMREGFEFKNAHFNYIPTYTGPGHASIYSGTTPRVHGIIANDWYDKYEKRMRYCTEDFSAQGVGTTGETGQRSPLNLKASTLSDELRLFYQDRAKVVAVSLKDRGAILPGGHQPNGAYWYDGETGRFVTSTFYMKVLPDWVAKFNDQKLPDTYMKVNWDTYKPIDQYVESAADDRAYEAVEDFDIPHVFPYDYKQIGKKHNLKELIKTTPYGNVLTTEMALAALEGENLGQDGITDLLAVSYSSTDYIGHAYGPYSKEIEDTYIRLDMELERLMNGLDEKIGKGQWMMFLTADHAVAEIPAYLKEKGFNVDYTATSAHKKKIKEALKARFGTDDLIENVSNHQIFLNREVLTARTLDLDQVKKFLIDQLNQLTGISAAYDVQKLASYNGNDRDVRLLAAGIHAHQSGDIAYTNEVGWLGQWHGKNGGTTHGSGYAYDTHVPMLFYGWGIKTGSTAKYHPITDIVPTISTLLNIKMPSGCTGQPATELLD